jgi:hypothetical protein
MLLCGIIDELKKTAAADCSLLSYFFCQATDSRINNAIAVLHGLIYLLIDQQPALLVHVRKNYEHANKSLFTDANAWHALSSIFTNVLQDPALKTTYLVIDALDECDVGLPKLLDFVVQTSSLSTRVKWLLSSRNRHDIEQKLRLDDLRVRLSLELNENAEHLSHAVDVYINDKLSRLESLRDNELLRDQVRNILRAKAKGTFLWVALVVQELEKAESWDVLQVVEEVPTGLGELYHRMMDQIQGLPRRNSEFCWLLLSTASVAYRPLHLAEIAVLSGLPTQISGTARYVRKIVALCGSFLTVRDDQVYIIHQSAKDYLTDKARATIFPSGRGKTHHDIFARSLELMSHTLRSDIYNLCRPGCPIDEIKSPNPDPLAVARYSCVYWVDHLLDSASASGKRIRQDDDLQDDGTVHTFLKAKYLNWLEALSLLRVTSEGVLAMKKLENLLVRFHIRGGAVSELC